MNSYKVLYATTPGKLETSILATSLSEAKRKAYLVCAETDYSLIDIKLVTPVESDADSIRGVLLVGTPMMFAFTWYQPSSVAYILLAAFILLQFSLGIAKYARNILHLLAFVVLYGMLVSAGCTVLLAAEYSRAHPVLSATDQAIANWEKYKVEHGMK